MSVTLNNLGVPVAGVGACGVSSPYSVAAAQPAAYAPCFQYHVNATPSLYMLADTPCNVASVCNGKPYRSYATSNQYGLNSYVSKGLAVQGPGCTREFAKAAVSFTGTPCQSAFASYQL